MVHLILGVSMVYFKLFGPSSRIWFPVKHFPWTPHCELLLETPLCELTRNLRIGAQKSPCSMLQSQKKRWFHQSFTPFEWADPYGGVSKPIIINVSGVFPPMNPSYLSMFTRATRFWPKTICLMLSFPTFSTRLLHPWPLSGRRAVAPCPETWWGCGLCGGDSARTGRVAWWMGGERWTRKNHLWNDVYLIFFHNSGDDSMIIISGMIQLNNL